jgi:hypothetical protein
VSVRFSRIAVADDGKTRPDNILTHLVEVLKQVDYPTLNLGLVQAGRRGVGSDGLRDEAGSELRNASRDGRAADLEGSRSLDGTGGGSPQGADNGGAEHIEVEDRERDGYGSRKRVKNGVCVEGKRGSKTMGGRGRRGRRREVDAPTQNPARQPIRPRQKGMT